MKVTDTFPEYWNNRSVLVRVKLVMAAGLEGRRGSCDWEYINESEQQSIIGTILRLSKGSHNRFNRTARKLHVSKRFLEQQPSWIQKGRAPTCEEYTAWAISQHKNACQRYNAAWPMSYYQGRCSFHVQFNKPCTSFFSNTGICEGGQFHPERMRYMTGVQMQKSFRKAKRQVDKTIKN